MSTGTAEALGALIRAYREGRALTQQELGARLGVTAGAIAHYEAGRRSPRPKVARRLQEEMEVAARG